MFVHHEMNQHTEIILYSASVSILGTEVVVSEC